MDARIVNNGIVVEYIDSRQKLQACEEHLSKISEFSFDLEFDNNHYKYGITLCLIQVSSSERCFVIDTLQPLDLSGLFRLFENRSILKICFSPDQDLILLRSLNCRPQHIFDVAVAAKLLNSPSSGLAAILESRLQVPVDKKAQKSNWTKRPLSAGQVNYSAGDVVHLIKLRNMFEEEAKQKGILSWIEEENEFLDTWTEEEKNPDNFLTKKDKEAFSDHMQYVLNELLRYAHAVAKKADKPVGWLIKKQLLIDLVKNKLSIEELPALHGIHPSFKGSDFKLHFLNTLREADAKNISRRSPNPKPTEAQKQEANRQKMLAENIKASKFHPIKNAIALKYGEFAADFIFGEPHFNQLLKKNIKIPGLKMKYRADLISSTADELGIDLAGYL